jgi:histidinol-phosphate aminotransferase
VSRPGVRLDRNELSIGPAPACLDVHRSATAEELSSYAAPEPDGAYSPLTRRLAAELAVPEFRIGVGHDGEEGLLGRVFDLAATVGTTGRALLPDVSWPHYDTLRREADLSLATYPIVERAGRWLFDVDALLELHHLMPGLVLIPWVDNPTGALFPHERLPECWPRSPTRWWWSMRRTTDSPLTSLRGQLVDGHPNLAVLRTFAKAYGLARKRLAYGVFGDDFAHVLTRTRRYLGPSDGEAVALAALDATEHLEHVRAVRGRRAGSAVGICWATGPG